jgi:hypothetical protein
VGDETPAGRGDIEFFVLALVKEHGSSDTAAVRPWRVA